MSDGESPNNYNPTLASPSRSRSRSREKPKAPPQQPRTNSSRSRSRSRGKEKKRKHKHKDKDRDRKRKQRSRSRSRSGEGSRSRRSRSNSRDRERRRKKNKGSSQWTEAPRPATPPAKAAKVLSAPSPPRPSIKEVLSAMTQDPLDDLMKDLTAEANRDLNQAKKKQDEETRRIREGRKLDKGSSARARELALKMERRERTLWA